MERLLEDIRQRTQVDYLSDLHYNVSGRMILNLMEASLTAYSIEEWNDACSYIFQPGDSAFKPMHTYEEVKIYLESK